MARIDDYNQAFELTKLELLSIDPNLVARFSGARLKEEGPGQRELQLVFLNRPVATAWPALNFVYGDDQKELPIQQQVLLAHYLLGACHSKGEPLSGKWIAYQEIPDGRFYLDAFLKRAKNPLVQCFGKHPELLIELASTAYGARSLEHGDVSVRIQALPLTPLALILWKGDEEFPPEGNLLFDQNISRIFSAEDVAWLAGMAVYPLIGMCKSRL
jgi:hypothetical protein